MKLVLLLISFILISNIGEATTYYVSKNGNDSNSCNTATDPNGNNPKLTVADAINNCLGLASGNVIQVRAGTYNEYLSNGDVVNVNWPRGSSWNPGGYYTIQGYPGDSKPKFTASLDFHYRNASNGAFPQYILLDNIEVDMGVTVDDNNALTRNCLYFTMSHLKITNSKFGNVANQCISGGADDSDLNSSGNDFIFQFNEVHDARLSFDTGLWTQPGCGCPPGGCGCGTGAYCLYISPHNSLITDNIIHDCRGFALHFYHGGSNPGAQAIHDNIIANNTIYNAATSDGNRHNSLATIIDYGHDNLYYNNVLYDNMLGYGPALGTIQFGQYNNNRAYNNTIYNTGGLGVYILGGSGHDVRGNIIYQHTKAATQDDSGGSNTISNNFIDTNPSFVNPPDFHLNPGSPAASGSPNFSSVFTTDKGNSSRPSSGSWSYGAYQLSVPIGPTTYYVNPATGNDSNNGSSSTPWKTITRVKNAGASPTVGPGDIINIVVGNYTKSQYQSGINNFPVWSQGNVKGTSGSPIIIQSDPASSPTKARYDGERDGAWISFAPTAGTDYYVIIQNIEFQNYTGGVINIGNGSLSVPTASLAKHIAIIGNYFHDLHQIGAAVTGTYAAQNIIFKNNRMLRNGIPDPWCCAGDHVYYISHDSHFIVVDNNYGETIAGYHVHLNSDFDPVNGDTVNGSKTNNIIIRKNTTVNANAGSIIVCCAVDRNIYIYNNTNVSEANTYPAVAANTGIASTKGAISFHNGAWEHRDVRIKNNISYGYVDANNGGLLYTDSGFNPIGLFELDYNWWELLGGGAGGAYKWLGTFYNSVTAFQNATIYGDHDRSGDPLFTSLSTRDFTLQNTSLAIDRGTTLTTTSTACSGNSVTVADAGYFHDGYGMIQGDTVQIANQSRILTSVNYTTNVLTWGGSALACSIGANVSLPYAGLAPDMGANESSVSTAIPAPTNLRVTTNN